MKRAKNTINYFQIAYCLQREVAKQLNLTKLHFYSDLQLINITLGMTFGIDIFHTISKVSLKFTWSVKYFNFDDCIEKLESKCYFNYDIIKPDFHFNKILIVTLADHLFEVEIFDEAVELYQQFLAASNKNISEINTNRTTARIYLKIGRCMTRLQKYSDSAKSVHKTIEAFQLTCVDQETDEELAIAFNQLGSALTQSYHYDDALIHFKRSLEIRQKLSDNFKKDGNVADILNNIGNCFMKMHQYNNALIHLKQSLEIKKNVSLNLRKDSNVAGTLFTLAVV